MLCHPDTDNGVVFPRIGEFAIVFELDVDFTSQAGTGNQRGRERGLPFAERDPSNPYLVVLGGEEREAAPATSDIEHALAGFEAELSTDVVELRSLGLVETV